MRPRQHADRRGDKQEEGNKRHMGHNERIAPSERSRAIRPVRRARTRCGRVAGAGGRRRLPSSGPRVLSFHSFRTRRTAPCSAPRDVVTYSVLPPPRGFPTLIPSGLRRFRGSPPSLLRPAATDGARRGMPCRRAPSRLSPR